VNDSSKLPNSLWRDPTLQAIPVSVRLLTDRQFEEHQDKLMSFLARSLDARNKPEELLELQAEMASFLLGAQGEQKRLEAELGESAVADRGHHDSPGVVVEVCKRLQGIVRQIADGIAWRTLRYDRPMLRILALKPPTGHMELASAKTEFIAAADVVETGELVVVNDLTVLNAFIRVPCQIVRAGRRMVYRLLAWNPWQDVFLRGVDALRCPMRC